VFHSSVFTLGEGCTDWENRVSIKKLLRTLAICLPLIVGILGAVPMKPEEIEDLMHNLNQPKITITIPGESENGDEPIEAN
jgi:hypothetical protein